MSLLFYENQLRFQPKDSSEIKPTVEHTQPAQFDLLSYSSKLKKCSSSHQNKNSPKIPSNLVKVIKTTPTFIVNNNSNVDNLHKNTLDEEKQQLVSFISEKEQSLTKARSEYDQNYENYFKLAKKFHIEKLNNLKLTFKNQILKQQIYFETELAELSKECQRDMLSNTTTTTKTRNSSSSHKSNKQDREKHLLRIFKQDMRKLLDYMKEALMNSSDTLIEAYETCHVLKSLEKIENSFYKQNVIMKNSTSNLIRDEATKFDTSKILNRHEEKNDEDNSDDQTFNKYKYEMDELIHTLDDIELQHLQRKDQLTSRTKFFNKLKSKFKFIETKYALLNRQCANLRQESVVYKQLWEEKQLSESYDWRCIDNGHVVGLEGVNEEISCYCKCSTSSSLVPSSRSSRSVSISSLSEEQSSSSTHQLIVEQNSLDEAEDDEASLSGSSSSDSSSSSSLQPDEDERFLDTEDDSNLPKIPEYPASYLSMDDYNRKLDIVKNLINLYVSKQYYSKEPTSPSTLLTINNLWRQTQTIDTFNSNRDTNNIFSQALTNIRHGSERDSSCLDLSECSLDGNRVVIENLNLRTSLNLSEWVMTRQIDALPVSSTYKLPSGSVVKSGKVLTVNAPFQTSPLEFLLAIKHKNQHVPSTNNDKNKLKLKVITKLMSQDGCVKAVHTQEIPQFYQEIFKYANLIRLV